MTTQFGEGIHLCHKVFVCEDIVPIPVYSLEKVIGNRQHSKVAHEQVELMAIVIENGFPTLLR